MELYFNMFKIKYIKLDELLEEFTFIKGEEVFIYIIKDLLSEYSTFSKHSIIPFLHIKLDRLNIFL